MRSTTSCQRWVGAVLEAGSVMISTLFLTLCVYAQDAPTAQEVLAVKEPECRHTSMLDMQEKARFRGGPYMKVTVYTGKHLEYIFQDRYRTEHRALYIEKVSIIPDEFAKKYDNEKWWILYCDEHKVVHQIVKYLPPDKR